MWVLSTSDLTDSLDGGVMRDRVISNTAGTVRCAVKSHQLDDSDDSTPRRAACFYRILPHPTPSNCGPRSFSSRKLTQGTGSMCNSAGMGRFRQFRQLRVQAKRSSTFGWVLRAVACRCYYKRSVAVSP